MLLYGSYSGNNKLHNSPINFRPLINFFLSQKILPLIYRLMKNWKTPISSSVSNYKKTPILLFYGTKQVPFMIKNHTIKWRKNFCSHSSEIMQCYWPLSNECSWSDGRERVAPLTLQRVAIIEHSGLIKRKKSKLY